MFLLLNAIAGVSEYYGVGFNHLIALSYSVFLQF